MYWLLNLKVEIEIGIWWIYPVKSKRHSACQRKVYTSPSGRKLESTHPFGDTFDTLRIGGQNEG